MENATGPVNLDTGLTSRRNFSVELSAGEGNRYNDDAGVNQGQVLKSAAKARHQMGSHTKGPRCMIASQ